MLVYCTLIRTRVPVPVHPARPSCCTEWGVQGRCTSPLISGAAIVQLALDWSLFRHRPGGISAHGGRTYLHLMR